LIRFIGDNDDNKLLSITWVHYPRLELTFGGKNAERENEIIEVSEFIGIKSWKAKGKRLSNYEVNNIQEIEPVIKDDYDHHEEEAEVVKEETKVSDSVDVEDVPFEINRPTKDDDDTNQMSLF